MANVPPFYIAQLQNPEYNPFGTIQFLCHDDNPTTKGLFKDDKNDLCFAMTDDFTLSMTSSWTGIDITGLQDMIDKGSIVASAAGGAASNMFGGFLQKIPGIGGAMSNLLQNVGQKRFKPLALSYLTWLKSEIGSFHFNLYRFALKPEDDTTKSFRNLARMVMPSFYTDGIVTTPGGYVPPIGKNASVSGIWDTIKNVWNSAFSQKGTAFNDEGEIPGTVTVQIGKWLTLRHLLVENLSFTSSKVCTKNGNPIYTKGTIDLRPYRMTIYDDIMNMFRNLSSDPGDRGINTKSSAYNKKNDVPPDLFAG